jgi:hypothetical protein
MVMCSVVKADGMPCKAHAKKDHIFCATHLRLKEKKASGSDDDSQTSKMSTVLTLPVVNHPMPSNSADTTVETLAKNLSDLTSQVSDLQELIAGMEIGKAGKKHSAKPKQVTEKGILRKAKFMFYHENKTRADILGEIVPRLESAGLLFKRKSVVEGVEVFKDVIPWQMVKEGTDALFESLPDESRDLYMAKARIVMTM